MEENQSAHVENNNDIPLVQEAPPPRKKRIPLKFKFLILVAVIVASWLTYSTISENIRNMRRTRIDFNVQDAPTVIVKDPEPWLQWENYVNPKYKFSFEYPSEAVIQELEDSTFQVVFAGERQLDPITEGSFLLDGYIFRVIVTKVSVNRDVEDVAKRKLLNYTQTCPDIHTSSSVEKTVVDTIAGHRFSVTNCLADYQEIYVLYDDMMYQITRVYRGDIGFKEKYRRSTENIFNSFEFLGKPVEEEGRKLVTYANNTYKFSFDHYSLDPRCCKISKPVFGNIDEAVVLGDPQTASGSEGRFNGIGIFVERNTDGVGFTQYINLQKEALAEEYKIITGRSVSGSESDIIVGGQRSVILKGYTWWDGDMIFIPIPGGSRILIISTMETSPRSFERELEGILKSFQFL
jgi:hypothetical protein